MARGAPEARHLAHANGLSPPQKKLTSYKGVKSNERAHRFGRMRFGRCRGFETESRRLAGSTLGAILTTVLVGPRKYTGEGKGWLLTAFQLLPGNGISRAAPGRISMAFGRVSQRGRAIHRP